MHKSGSEAWIRQANRIHEVLTNIVASCVRTFFFFFCTCSSDFECFSALFLVSAFFPKDVFHQFSLSPKQAPETTVESVCSRFDIPDAAHAAGLRSQLAPLQLGGHDLTFGLQLPGEAFELQLLPGTREREQMSVNVGLWVGSGEKLVC